MKICWNQKEPEWQISVCML